MAGTPEDVSERTCAVCGLPEMSRRNPLCGEGLHDELLVHLHCFNSPEGRAWRDRKRAAEPSYDRYMRLMTSRQPAACPGCGAGVEVSPKAVGMGAGSWAVNCTACHRTGRKRFFGYGPSSDAYTALEVVRGDFVRSRDLDRVKARVREIAAANDRFVDAEPCACGGRYSLAAKPRCPRCGAVVIDSYFHLVSEPLDPETREWLEGQMNSYAAKPEDWDDADGWERYYAGMSDAAVGYEAGDLGSLTGESLAGLIGDLRANGAAAVWFPGCGVSPLPRLLSAFGLAVHATDVSPTAVRLQQGGRFEREVNRLKRQVGELGQPVPDTPGPFTAAVHDARTPYLDAAFDLIVNQRAIQGFPRPSMERVAASHAAALKPGGHAIFDTINVQGERRDELEGCLVGAGFHVPLFEANRRLRRALAATGIPHVFILGRPMIPRTGPYAEDHAKWRSDTAVLRRTFADHEAGLEADYEAEQQRVGPDAKVATVIYSTG